MNELLDYFQIDLKSAKGYLKIFILAGLISFTAHSIGSLINIA
ncbi:MAG: hypothetical protein RR425_05510 [Erysipelotrichales bacterium]